MIFQNVIPVIADCKKPDSLSNYPVKLKTKPMKQKEVKQI